MCCDGSTGREYASVTVGQRPTRRTPSHNQGLEGRNRPPATSRVPGVQRARVTLVLYSQPESVERFQQSPGVAQVHVRARRTRLPVTTLQEQDDLLHTCLHGGGEAALARRHAEKTGKGRRPPRRQHISCCWRRAAASRVRTMHR